MHFKNAQVRETLCYLLPLRTPKGLNIQTNHVQNWLRLLLLKNYFCKSLEKEFKIKSKPEKHRMRFGEVAAGSFEKSFSIHSQTVDLGWSLFQCVIFVKDLTPK